MISNSAIYTDLMRIAREVSLVETPGAAADLRIPVFFYNENMNHFHRYNIETNGWEFTGYVRPQDPTTPDGRYISATFGIQIVSIQVLLNVSGLPAGYNLLLNLSYDEPLDTDLYNPHLIHERGLRFLQLVINSMRDCKHYKPVSLEYVFADLVKPEQIAVVEAHGMFSYSGYRK